MKKFLANLLRKAFGNESTTSLLHLYCFFNQIQMFTKVKIKSSAPCSTNLLSLLRHYRPSLIRVLINLPMYCKATKVLLGVSRCLNK
jgi:hypothetical protein